MKKGLKVLLSASIFTGIAGSFLFRKNAKNNAITDELKTKYVGVFSFKNSKKTKNHTLAISNKFELTIDEQPVKGEIIELNPKQLIVQDKYGYQINVEADGLGPVSIYDEADDITYTLKKNEN